MSLSKVSKHIKKVGWEGLLFYLLIFVTTVIMPIGITIYMLDISK